MAEVETSAAYQSLSCEFFAFFLFDSGLSELEGYCYFFNHTSVQSNAMAG